MNSTTSSEYTENIYIHLKLIFAFAAQSSLCNNKQAVHTCGACARAVPTRQHPCRIHKPVLGTRYSGTVPCHDITVYYVQLHMDDAILCIIDDVMIVLY